jgi:transglutaminase-like putative cysteine protease
LNAPVAASDAWATTRLSIACGLAVLATSLSLTSLFSDQEWFWSVVLVVAVLTATAIVTQRLGRLGAFSAQLLALLVVLTVQFTSQYAIAGFIPTPSSIQALAQLLRDATVAVNTSSTPVASEPVFTLLVCGGVGLVAIAVHGLAVGLRSPVLAGLPLVGLYAVSVLTLDRALSPVPFALAAAGWLAIVLADGTRRLRSWGPRVDRVVDAPREPSPLAASGRTLGVLAIALAVSVPAVLPQLADTPSGFFGIGGSGGSSPVETVNPYLDLRDNLTRPDDTEVLRYRSSSGDGANLRLVTLDTYSGGVWQQSPLRWSASNQLSEGIPLELVGADTPATSEYRTRIEITDLDENRLPLPYPTVRAAVDGDWRYDEATLNVLGPEGSTQGLTYEAQSLQLQLTAAELADAPPTGDGDVTAALQLPNDLPVVLANTAVAVTAGAGSPYERAVALQQFFRSEFAYDLDYRPTGEPIADFLQKQRGYCQQFASTMALMARSLGIPARVNVGFAQGERDGDWWSVSWHDTHAWPELYLSGFGWIPFEPTPRAGGGFSPPAYAVPLPAVEPDPALAPTGDLGRSSPDRIDAGSTTTDPAGVRDIRGREGAGAVPIAGGLGWRTWLLIAGLMIAALVLAVPAVARRLVRARRLRRTGAAGTEARWREWQDTFIDCGGGWSAGWTPRQAADATAGHLGEDASEVLSRLSRQVETVRYAELSADREIEPLDISGLLRAHERSLTRPGRWRARLVPISVWRRLLASSETAMAAGSARLDRAKEFVDSNP